MHLGLHDLYTIALMSFHIRLHFQAINYILYEKLLDSICLADIYIKSNLSNRQNGIITIFILLSLTSYLTLGGSSYLYKMNKDWPYHDPVLRSFSISFIELSQASGKTVPPDWNEAQLVI